MRLNLPVTDEEYRLPSDEVIITRTDAQGNIEYANQAFFRSSGYDRAEIIGQPQNIIRHPDMPAAAFADMWATIRAGTPWTGVVKNRRKDGGFTGCWPTSRPCSRTASRRATCR
ncbi:PAS domain-containing protein [Cupriavidus basilensis]